MLEYRYVQVESLQKEEIRAQSADSSKAYRKQAFNYLLECVCSCLSRI